MKKIFTLMGIVVLMAGFTACTKNQTELSGDTLDTSVTVSGHVRYISYGKSGAEDPEIADLKLPSGGGKWLFVDASRFEDVEQLNEYQGNMEMPAEFIEKFTAAIDPAYLKAFDLFGVIEGYGAQLPE